MGRARWVAVGLIGVLGATLVVGLAYGPGSQLSRLQALSGEKTVDSDPIDDRRLAGQASLQRAATEVEALVARDGLEGLTGTAFNVEDQILILYWHGETPRAFAARVRQLVSPVAVEILTAANSGAELDREARRLMSLSLIETGGADITEVGPLQDYSGLEVAVAAPDQIEKARSTITSPVDLTFTVQSPVVPAVG